MGSIWQSDRFRMGMATVIGVVINELVYLATGNRLTPATEIELVAAMISLIGFDAFRKMRKLDERGQTVSYDRMDPK